MYIKENIDAVSIKTGKDWCSAIILSHKGRKFMFISAYLVPTGSIEKELQEITSIIRKYPGVEVTVSCDSNAHSYLWHAKNTNERGH